MASMLRNENSMASKWVRKAFVAPADRVESARDLEGFRFPIAAQIGGRERPELVRAAPELAESLSSSGS